ncbi:MAG: hypothetical protein PHU85_15020, partial [Phycisphaerae bacterium]|nr:hypothetical protein [Phycisphaerae bacterium]
MRHSCLISLFAFALLAVAAAAPTSQPAQPPVGWEPLDGPMESYKSLASAEVELAGKLWARKAQQLPGAASRGRFGGRVIVDGNGNVINPADEAGENAWTFMLAADGERIALVSSDITERSPLIRLIGKPVSVRCRLSGKTVAGDATWAAGWIREVVEPTAPPPDKQAGWIAVEGENDRYGKWIGAEITLRGRLEMTKVNGIGRPSLDVSGRKVQLAKGWPDCDKMVGQLVEVRGKAIDGQRADSTASVSAGWVRPAQLTKSDEGWQVVFGDRPAYQGADGGEVLFKGVLRKRAGPDPRFIKAGNNVWVNQETGQTAAGALPPPGPTQFLIQTAQGGKTVLETDAALTALADRPVEAR